MIDRIRSGGPLVVGLAALALFLAWIAATVGATDAVAVDRGVTFVVSEGTVTVSDGGTDVTVVDDLANVTAVEIADDGAGRFTIATERDEPLSAADRDRARAIARGNETVAGALGSMDVYSLAVDPVYRMDADSSEQIGGESIEVDASADVSTIEFESDSLETDEGRVVVNRKPETVPDVAAVRVIDPTAEERSELRYSVRVDLEAERVTSVTDWEEIRGPSPAGTGSDAGE